MVTLQAAPGGAAEPADTAFRVNMGNLPGSTELVLAMKQARLEAREVLIRSRDWTHKIVVFRYPPDGKSLWVWDPQSQAHELVADFNDPLALARAWGAIEVPRERIVSASFGLTTGPKVPHCPPAVATC